MRAAAEVWSAELRLRIERVWNEVCFDRPSMASSIAQRPRSAADISPWLHRLVRVGYGAKGVIYLLIGTLALRLATGNRGRITDSSGALQVLLEQPFGRALLAVVGLGILAYAGWEIAQAIIDTRRKGSGVSGWLHRALSMIKGVVYGTLGIEATRSVLGMSGESQAASDYAREAMRFPLGGIFFGLVGAGIAVYGVRQIWMAWQGQFDDDLNEQQLRREGAAWVLPIGRAGTAARGVILTIMGIAIMRAGFDRTPAKAEGMSDSMWTLMGQPYGQWLLAAVAAGLMCFGLFQLLHARYARI